MYIDETVKIPTGLPNSLQYCLDELLHAYKMNDMALFFADRLMWKVKPKRLYQVGTLPAQHSIRFLNFWDGNTMVYDDRYDLESAVALKFLYWGGDHNYRILGLKTGADCWP